MTKRKTKFIKISYLPDITNFIKLASAVDGDVEVHKGKWVIDAKSIMGVMSLDMSSGATVVYPETAIEFDEFLCNFEG